MHSLCSPFSAEMDTTNEPSTPATTTAGSGTGGDSGDKQSATPASAATPGGGATTTTKEPILSTHYHVRRTDGSWHVGEVIQKRNNLENGLTEYYVHYKDSERGEGGTKVQRLIFDD